MKTIKQIDQKIREICTYHGDEGTSGYLLSNEQFDQIGHAITELLEGLRVEEKSSPDYEKEPYAEMPKEYVGYNQCVREINQKIDQAKGGER